MTDIQQRKRRVSLTVEEVELLASQVTYSTTKLATDLYARMSAIVAEENNPEHRRITDAYRAAVQTKDGETEMDEDAEVSLGDDPGAYVMIWKWVPAASAGLSVTDIDDEDDEDANPAD